MKPSDAELQEMLHDDLLRKGWLPSKSQRSLIGILIRDELQRRQQSESVLSELVKQWHDEWCLVVQSGGMKGVTLFEHVANKAAAYGREQAHNDIRISTDQWAELVARHPETMQILFGGQP